MNAFAAFLKNKNPVAAKINPMAAKINPMAAKSLPNPVSAKSLPMSSIVTKLVNDNKQQLTTNTNELNKQKQNLTNDINKLKKDTLLITPQLNKLKNSITEFNTLSNLKDINIDTTKIPNLINLEANMTNLKNDLNNFKTEYEYGLKLSNTNKSLVTYTLSLMELVAMCDNNTTDLTEIKKLQSIMKTK